MADIGSSSKLSILLVEDDLMFLQSSAMFLRMDGFEVIPALHSLEAIAKAISKRPDLVLLDLYLHDGVDGIECLRRMRAQGYAGPIFMLTHEESPEVMETARAVTKILIRTMRRVLKDHDEILKSAFLRSRGLTESQIEQLAAFRRMGYPSMKAFAAELHMNEAALSKRFHRIMSKLGVDSLVRLVRILTIVEMFGKK